jgi:hypothetical protein
MTPTTCRSRLPRCPPFSANFKIAPKTTRVIPAAMGITRHPFRGLDRELTDEMRGVPEAERR